MASLSLLAACGGGSGSDVDCGEGTSLQNGTCVVTSSSCGPNTVLKDGQCKPAGAVCGSGTSLDQATGACVPTDQITCGSGTEKMGGECVPTSTTSCGPGTEMQNGECVSTTDPSDACKMGLVWDDTQKRCKLDGTSCGEGTQLDAQTGTCVAGMSQCGADKVLDGNKCVDKKTLCGGDGWFNKEIGQCVSSNVITGDCMSPMTLDSDITMDTMLPKGNCYEVSGIITIKEGAALTIEAGARLAFKDDAGLEVLDTGTSLTVNGTEQEPVYFTGTKQKAGHWKGIFMRQTQSSSNKIQHAVIEYAGESSWDDDFPSGAGLTLGEDSYDPSVRLKIQNTTLRNNLGFGLIIGGVVNKTEHLKGFQDNTLTKNELGAIHLPPWMVDTLDTNSNYTGNTDDRVVVTGGKIVGGTIEWKNLGVPYNVIDTVSIQGSTDWRVNAGVEVQFAQSTGVKINKEMASFELMGTKSKPVLLTGTKQTAGHWKGLYVRNTQSTANKIHHTTIEYAGEAAWDSDYSHGAGLTLGENSYDPSVRVEIQNSTLRHNSGYGIIVGNVVKSSHLNGFEKNTLTKNEEGAARTSPWAIDKFDANSSFTGNTKDRIVSTGGKLESTIEWKSFGVPYWVTGTVSVESGKGTLKVKPGVTVKFEQSKGLEVKDGAGLHAKGTASKPITFTGTQQVAGFWPGIWYEATSSPFNRLEHVTVSYGGGPPWKHRANLTLWDDDYSSNTTVAIALKNVTLSHSLNHGVHISDEDDAPQSVNLRGCSNVTFSSITGTKVTGERSNWNGACGAP